MSWLRNIPFILIGVIVDVLLFRYSRKEADDPFRGIWFWVLVSFGCYMPVALIHLGGMKDALLMIVKTIAYVMIVVLGYMRIPYDIKSSMVFLVCLKVMPIFDYCFFQFTPR
ncbi:uncharacterized protein [Blastocystis hominis]|uniref:Uncharacterized protein n=1 Tax=Blastocystis hominis TaxID=12968 RepID=D8MAP5_BLAHO|nr:uncharacterized protein [Blastocystis hominis]CBK25134.2 unnamed protein product [Blastocystis hominis]|eukprot:XP_012899182.1 uncharacterized protein [Blastocystis hominis]